MRNLLCILLLCCVGCWTNDPRREASNYGPIIAYDDCWTESINPEPGSWDPTEESCKEAWDTPCDKCYACCDSTAVECANGCEHTCTLGCGQEYIDCMHSFGQDQWPMCEDWLDDCMEHLPDCIQDCEIECADISFCQLDCQDNCDLADDWCETTYPYYP